jgi:Ca-activated chloride channel family protein
VIGRAASLVLALAGAVSASSTDQSTRPAAAVDVYATVEAANGVPLEGLAREDFDVLSDGAAVPFTLTPGPQPMDTLLVADLTTSVTNRVRTVVALPLPEAFGFAADRLITDVRTADRARLVGMIGARLVPGPGWTADRLALQRSARVLATPDGPVEPSPLWDALDASLAMFEPASDRRRHILLVTDGRATANKLPLDDVVHRAMEANVAISIVELDPAVRSLGLPHSERSPGPRALLERLTSNTGGVHRVVTPDARGTHQTRAAVGQMLDLIRTSYRLTFVPPPAAARLRRVEVRVNRPGLTVRARASYASGE